MSTFFTIQSTTTDFISDTHHGHQIATYRHSQGWLAYLDLIMQPNRQFASAEDAIRWLRRKVEDREFDDRVVAFGRRRRIARTELARAA